MFGGSKPSDYGLTHTEFRPGQKEAIDWILDQDGVMIVSAPTGCHRIGQKILTYDGDLKNVEDIQEEDTLMGWDSTPRRVLRIIRGNGKMYEIIPVKGNRFIVNEDHILTLVRTNTSKKNGRKFIDHKNGNVVDVSVREWLRWTKTQKHIHKLLRVGVSFPIKEINLPIDPYYIGIFLGDGCLTKGVGVSKIDKEIYIAMSDLANKYNLKLRSDKGKGKSITYFITASRGKPNPVRQILDSLGMMNKTAATKFVPKIYMTASLLSRLELLAGILDTDGYLGDRNHFDFISKSYQLAQDVTFLARSVGLAAYIRHSFKASQNGTGGIYYRVSISGNLDMIPTRIERKIAKKRQQKKNVQRTGFSVYPLPEPEDYYGFILDGDGRYLLDDFTVTHNSGKTSLAAAVSTREKVIALCRTKNLQATNYDRTYGFEAIYGKANYDCVHPEFVGTKADTCAFADQSMYLCPYAGQCPYLIRKAAVMEADKASMNYAYYLSAPWVRESPPDCLFLDEAHQLPDITLDWAGLMISEKTRVEWDLPDFPEITVSQRSSMFLNATNPVDVAIGWMEQAKSHLNHLFDSLMKDINDEENRKKGQKCDNLARKISATIHALRTNPNDWYIKSGVTASKDEDGNFKPTLVCKPLSAKYHFSSYFKVPKMVLMSATLGNVADFAAELGIADYSVRQIPNQWPPETRPVIDLGCPRLGRGSTITDYEKQADIIARAIKDCPSDWSGIIHVTRKTEAFYLKHRLSERGLGNRVWTPEVGDGTDIQMIKWERAKKNKKGILAISWTWWEGVDLTDSQICIVAKTPFAFLGDEYEQARMTYSARTYQWRAATQLEQALGRTRRGDPSDYDRDGKKVQLVAIADGNWSRIKNSLSQDLLDAIVKY